MSANPDDVPTCGVKSQVDMVRRCAWIHPDEAKAGNAIRVPLSDDAMAVLEEQCGKSDVWVFPMADGNPLPKLKSRDWKDVVIKAQIAYCTWHDLRHTWATWHLMGGTPLEVLQKLGGWRDLRMVLKICTPSNFIRGSICRECEAI